MKYFWLTIKKMFRFLLKPLSFVPALCVMYMIFSFSAQTADESGQLSMLVSEKVVLLLGKLTSGNLDTAQVGVYADEIHFLIRKMAHFSEYLLLGLTLSLPLYVYRLRGFWLNHSPAFWAEVAKLLPDCSVPDLPVWMSIIRCLWQDARRRFGTW